TTLGFLNSDSNPSPFISCMPLLMPPTSTHLPSYVACAKECSVGRGPCAKLEGRMLAENGRLPPITTGDRSAVWLSAQTAPEKMITNTIARATFERAFRVQIIRCSNDRIVMDGGSKRTSTVSITAVDG